MRVNIILGTADAIEREAHLYSQLSPPKPSDSVCGTPVCLCGWAKYVELGPKGYKSWLSTLTDFHWGDGTDLAQAFGISTSLAEDLYQARGSGWQEPYRSQFALATTRKQRAQVAAAMLRALAKEGE